MYIPNVCKCIQMSCLKSSNGRTSVPSRYYIKFIPTIYTYIYIYIWGKKNINPDGTRPTVLATNSDLLSESGSSTRPSQHALLLVHVHMGVVSQLVGVCGTIVSYTHESNLNCTHPGYTHLKWLMSTHLAYWEYSHYGRHPVLKLLPASLLLVWVPIHSLMLLIVHLVTLISHFIRLLVWYQSYYNQTNHCLFLLTYLRLTIEQIRLTNAWAPYGIRECTPSPVYPGCEEWV